jgi:hypothetical protein
MLLLTFRFQYLSTFNLLSFLMEPLRWQTEKLRRNVDGVSELCCTVPDLQYTDATKCYDSYRRKSRKRWTLQGTNDNTILFTSHTSPVSVFLHQREIKYTVGGQHRPFRWQHILVFSWGCRCHHVHRKQDLHEHKNLVLVYISCDSSQRKFILILIKYGPWQKNWVLVWMNYNPSQKNPTLLHIIRQEICISINQLQFTTE